MSKRQQKTRLQAGSITTIQKQKGNSDYTKPSTKWQRVLNALCGRSYNRFEAALELSDWCLNSTVSEIQGKGITVFREYETVPGFEGIPTRCCRYWIGPDQIKRVKKLLGAIMAKDKLSRAKSRRTNHTYSAKPHHIFRSSLGNDSPASVLSHKAFRLLDNLLAQYNGLNNGDLSAAFKIMKSYGWESRGDLHDSIQELVATGFVEQTRQGGRNRCSLFAVTWLSIDECDGKLDLQATSTPSNLWKADNCKLRDQAVFRKWKRRRITKTYGKSEGDIIPFGPV